MFNLQEIFVCLSRTFPKCVNFMKTPLKLLKKNLTRSLKANDQMFRKIHNGNLCQQKLWRQGQTVGDITNKHQTIQALCVGLENCKQTGRRQSMTSKDHWPSMHLMQFIIRKVQANFHAVQWLTSTIKMQLTSSGHCKWRSTKTFEFQVFRHKNFACIFSAFTYNHFKFESFKKLPSLLSLLT